MVSETGEVGGEDEAEDGEQHPGELRRKLEGPAQKERGDAAYEEKEEVAEDDTARTAMRFDRGGESGGGGWAGVGGGLHEIFTRRTQWERWVEEVTKALGDVGAEWFCCEDRQTSRRCVCLVMLTAMVEFA